MNSGIVYIVVFFLMVLSSVTKAQDLYLSSERAWIDSVLQSMSIEEKVGQLFMIRAFSHDDPEHINDIKRQVNQYHVGGICFFQGDPTRQATLVQTYQDLSKIPLLIGLDAEWGLGMRFKEKAISFPRQMTIGAISDHQLIYRMGREIGRQCLLTGVNLNFAPVVDVNNNPENPVINFRSFGEDKINVASKAYAYMRGLSDAGVMASAKHFPGHGDTGTDSHYELPVIAHNRSRLDSVELFPFQMMIDQGVPAIMVAHLQVPALDDRPNRPTTISSNVVTGLLREEMGFKRLIITDAMEMKAVTKHYGPGEANLEAFLAGNDLILLPEDMSAAYETMLQAVENGTISEDRLHESIRRILSEKYRLGLHNTDQFSNLNNLSLEVNSIKAQVIKSQIYAKAITLVANDKGILPLKDLKNNTFGSISLGSDRMTVFQQRLLSYIDSDNYALSKEATSNDYSLKLTQLSKKDIVFVSLHDMSWYASRDYGVIQQQIDFIRELAKQTQVILTMFGSPYSLKYFGDLSTILVAYEEDELAQDAAAQAIIGALDIVGKLPVTAGPSWPVGHGITVPGLKRLGFAIPEAVGLHSDSLQRIANIVDKMIQEKAAPGCQVLIAKDNKVVFWKSFGYHTYDKRKPVTRNDIYDVASITKIMASTLSMMHLQERGLFDLKKPIAHYFPEEDTTNKSQLIYEDIMAHVGKLLPWIPFYANTLSEGSRPRPDPAYYRTEKCDSFSIEVTPGLYLRNDYPDSIWRQIFSSSLRDRDGYRYSDLAFYILNRTIEKLSGANVDRYVSRYFYDPMGLRWTAFNPLRYFSRDQIPPTEIDDYYRMTTIQGTVHDMGAAMLNGVSGHAGLFSNALDLGILMQMLLNKGYYGGQKFLDSQTIKQYTQRHWRSTRRGIGFDLKELNPNRRLNMSEKASRHTFGHLGFTGTAVFGDPEHNIVYVFLSNRTYPTMDNNKLGRNNYRPRIQTLIYNALMSE